MANPFTASLGTFLAGSATVVAAAQAPAAAGNLNLVGGGVVVLDKPRSVLLTWGAEVAAKTVTITGTNETGNVISEKLTAAAGAGSTAATIQNFLTVTQVAVSGPFNNNVSVGTVGANAATPVARTPWFHVDFARIPSVITFAVNGTYTNGYLIEVTLDDPNAGYEALSLSGLVPESVQPQSNVPPVVYAEPANFGAQPGAKKTVNFIGTIGGAAEMPVFAARLATFDVANVQQVQFMQAGYAGA